MIVFTLDQLEVLETIERSGSFSAAARELRRSTPAVSYAVKALEDTLGVELFDRSGHRARLTHSGVQVLAEARRVLAHARDLDRLAHQLREEWEPRLEVAVDGVLPMGPILRAVRRLTDQGAPTHVRVQVEYLTGVHHVFHQGDADLMLALDVRETPGLRLRPLPPVELWLLAHRDHPLHHLGRPVLRSDLEEHVELVVADSGRDPRDRDPPPSRLRLWVGSPHVFQVSDFHTKLDAVREGVGFGWMPVHLCERLIEAGEVLPLAFPEGSQHVFVPRLVEREARVRGRAAQCLVEALAEELGVPLL